MITFAQILMNIGLLLKKKKEQNVCYLAVLIQPIKILNKLFYYFKI
jgi:hypothetical protein